jgi:hypothetical protein
MVEDDHPPNMRLWRARHCLSRTVKRPMQPNAACLAARRLRLPHRLAASTANCAELHFAPDRVPTQLPAVDSVLDSARGCDAPL